MQAVAQASAVNGVRQAAVSVVCERRPVSWSLHSSAHSHSWPRAERGSSLLRESMP